MVLVTVDLLDLLGHLDSLDLLESPAERSEHTNSQPSIHININGSNTFIKPREFRLCYEYCVYFVQGTPGSDGPPGRDGATGIKVTKAL